MSESHAGIGAELAEVDAVGLLVLVSVEHQEAADDGSRPLWRGDGEELYGRFLELVENQLVEMTWMTGDGTTEGTGGAETILRIELIPKGDATQIRLTHSGLPTEKSRAGHQENWPLASG